MQLAGPGGKFSILGDLLKEGLQISITKGLLDKWPEGYLRIASPHSSQHLVSSFKCYGKEPVPNLGRRLLM